MISTQMLLSFDPAIPPVISAQISNAHRELAEEINRKATRPFRITSTFVKSTSDAALLEVRDKLTQLIEALNQ